MGTPEVIEALVPTQRRYPIRLIEFVRKLGEHDYRTCEAQAAVAKLGIKPTPSRSTIKRWLDPDTWEADNIRRHRNRLPGPQPRVKFTWQRKLERLLELRELGVTQRALANVMNHDFGLRMSEHNVRMILDGKYTEDAVKRLMDGERLKRGRRSGERRVA